MEESIVPSFAEPVRKFLGIRWTKKKIIWAAIILLVAGGVVFGIVKGKNTSGNITVEAAKKQDIRQTVLGTGQVVSGTDLDLSFPGSGIVSAINVKEGDTVKQGDVLAALKQSDQLASLTSARGALAQAQANYNKVLAGASGEEITVYQTALANAQSDLQNTKTEQQVLVDNAFKAMLNAGLEALASTGNTGSVTATVSGTYTGKDQGNYAITIYVTGNGLRYHVSGLETGDGQVSTIPQPIGTRGLYISFSSTSVPDNNSWTISIPNTQSSTYITAANAYQAALQTQASAIASAQNAVATAQANLDLKKAQARPADVQAAQAQILSAQGQVEAAQASLENTIVRAPAAGTITAVDIKVGEQATALKEVIVLQDVGNLHAEANISEANIASVKPNQDVDYTFDSLGTDRHFAGKVEAVNPASTVVSGVVNYKVTASLQNVPDIKPGMTANMTILVAQKAGVVTVPARAIISRGGKSFVRVIDDPKKKTYREVEVTTGLEADGGVVEITGGLNEGQQIVTFIKQ